MIIPTTPSEQLLFSTIRIEVKTKSGIGVGTGFFFQYKVNEETHVPLIITNKHVIAGAEFGSFFLHEAEMKDGKSIPSGRFFEVGLTDFDKGWTNHPNEEIDLCAMPFAPINSQATIKWGKTPFLIPFDQSLIWSDEKLSNLSAIEDVIMIGYPIGLWDQRNNLPIIRKGITATHPAIDFQGKSEFAIDIAAFPGSSGSPVFQLTEGGMYQDKKRNASVVGSRSIFLGVLHAGPTWNTTGEIIVQAIPTNQQTFAKVPIMINLGYVIKAKEVLCLAEHVVNLFKNKL